jgi:hypothetical protein
LSEHLDEDLGLVASIWVRLTIDLRNAEQLGV